jgi:hypothetical protein
MGGNFLIQSMELKDIFTLEDFTDEHKLIASSVEEFVRGEITPNFEKLEEINLPFLRELLGKAGNLGFLSTEVEEQYGGSNLDKVSSLLLLEKMAQGDSSFAHTYSVQSGIASIITTFGNDEQKRRYLPPLLKAQEIGAFAVTEPEAGSDIFSLKTTAELSSGEQHYLLNGTKQFISNGGLADIFITFAKIGQYGLTGFIVEKDTDGVSIGADEIKMGLNGLSNCTIYFENAKVPLQNILGEVGKGHSVLINSLIHSRLKMGSLCLGLSKAVLEKAVKYGKERIQFGKPICEFGLIKEKIAEMAMRIFAAETILFRTAGHIDAHHEKDICSKNPFPIWMKNALFKYSIECAIVKVFCSEILNYVVDQGLQIFGGYGYIRGYFVEKAYRDARIYRILDGTNEINRLSIFDLITKELSKRGFPFCLKAKVLPDQVEDMVNISDSGHELAKIENQKKAIILVKSIVLSLLELGAKKAKGKTFESDIQEILALISESIIETYIMESIFLRTLKTENRFHIERSSIQKEVASVYINYTFFKIFEITKEILSALGEFDLLRNWSKKFSQYIPFDTISSKRYIADRIIHQGSYRV